MKNFSKGFLIGTAIAIGASIVLNPMNTRDVKRARRKCERIAHKVTDMFD